jgi:hypothetical protein
MFEIEKKIISKIMNHPFIESHETSGAPAGRHAALWAATERSESLYLVV